MTTKKMIALILALAMAFALTACGTAGSESGGQSASISQASPAEQPADEPSNAPEDEEPAAGGISYPLVDEEVVLTQWGSMNPNVLKYIDDMSQNTVFEKLAEITGVRLECTTLSGGAVMEAFPIMIAGGEYTDFIDNVASQYNGGVDTAVDDGVIIDLTPYLEENCPDLVERMDTISGLKAFMISDEGYIPCFPEIRLNQNAVTGNGYMIRQDWLDELKLEMPGTFDDLYTVLSAFKTEKGADSALWMTSSLVGLLSDAYGAAINYEPMGGFYPYMIKDGQVLCGYQTEAFKGYISTMNKWWEEGLIWKDCITDTFCFGIGTSNGLAKFTGGQMGVAYGELADATTLPGQIEGGAVISAMPDPTPDGTKNHLSIDNNMFTYKWAVSADCENKELAVQYINYLYTDEGVELATYGVEGLACTKNADGSYTYTDVVLNNPDGIPLDSAWHMHTLLDELSMKDLTAQRQFYSEEALAFSDTWASSRDRAWAYPKEVSLNAGEGETFSNNFSAISTYVSECIAKFITGEMDLDENYDDFIARLLDMGLEECNTIKQQAYDRYMAKLG